MTARTALATRAATTAPSSVRPTAPPSAPAPAPAPALAPASVPVPAPPAVIRARVPVTLSRAGGRTAELVTFRGLPDEGEHVACVFPPAAAACPPGVPNPPASPAAAPAPLVRLHSECLTGDLLGSARCDCGLQLDEALALLTRHGGVLLYLRQEGRGIGLYNKLDAYVLQDGGADTFEANRLLGRGADERDYRSAAVMLHTLGTHRVRLLTNNPDKAAQLRAHGIDVTGILRTGVHLTPDNAAYLGAKARGGHHLPPHALRGPDTEVPG
ncbi:GTP cyclohydrolase II [Streptomyces griseoaurantiacus M045]|uniref:GTP cyclohydrolase II n=1 Tax=Streptomyces griseoaurantiacus M045 TaxID=996637 RepID=F3NJK2_9ACTN|nr:GTP cyclohydrolase II RibA [Streptomyces griseoaurantiacus]EGG46263.1 GTP cyclohydrolase II [Streptomyces griseoaurantiacus M045]